MKRLLMSVSLALAVSAGVAHAQSDPVKWKFSMIGPPQIYLNAKVIKPFIDKVNEDGKGVIEITNVPGLADFITAYDTLKNGVSEIGMVAPDLVRGKFNKLTVVQLPLIAKNAEEATTALWKMHEKGLFADEFDEVVPIAIGGFPQYGIHAKTPIKSLEELKGQKVRTATAVAKQIAEAFGGLTVSLPPSELNQALDKGIITHVMTDYGAVLGFGMANHARHHLNTELGSSAILVAMNKAAWDKATPAAKAVLQRNGFTALVATVGKGNDVTSDEDHAKLKADANHVFTDPTPADRQRWEQALAPIVDKWAKDTPNGAAVLAAYRAEVAAARKR